MTVSARFHGQVGTLAIDATFAVQATGVTALCGRSGSGKTTVLRCLAGLTRLAGRLEVNGAIWQDERSFVPPEHRHVGLVFQGSNLLPHLSVRDNLAYAARRAGDPLATEEVAERTGITDLLGRTPARLSGGEAQRVAIARALLIRPKLLLLDEPLSALDSVSKGELAAYLAELLPRLALPVFYVTHDAEEVARVADRRILIEDGRIQVIDGQA